MKKKMLLTFAVLALTVGQATAQRVLPKMQGIAIGGGMVDGKGDSFYGGLTVDTYTKGGNKWVFGAEYLQRNHKYEYGEDGRQTIPVSQFTAEGGYYKQVLSDASKSFFVYVGASALAGYEMVNWNKQLLDDGSRLTGRDGFVYGCAATLNVEWYLSDKVVLTGNVRERFLRGQHHWSEPYSVRDWFEVHHQLTEGMDIEKIKETPIADFLSRLGFHPVKRRGAVLWYHAPYRGDKSPSFKLDTRKEKWFDFGMGEGGDIFTLAGKLIPSNDSTEGQVH